MKRRSKCGKEIPNDSVFCPFCGQTIVATYDELRYRQSALPRPESTQKHSSTMSTGKLVFLILSVLSLVFLLVFAIFNRSIMFGSFDPDTVNSKAGKAVISYNLDTEKYTKDYLSKVQVASSPKYCGYIVKYKKSMETRDNYYTTSRYSSTGIGMDAHQEIIYVEIYNVRTGETIAKNTFSAFLPWETTTTYFYVDEWKVENWIKETIDNNK